MAAAEVRLGVARLGLGDDPRAVAAEDIDDSLLTSFGDDPTLAAMEASPEPTGALDLRAGGDEGLDLSLDEPVERSSSEARRTRDQDAAYEWADGVLICTVRRHDYRLFRLFLRP
jgi:hypothetical protein